MLKVCRIKLKPLLFTHLLLILYVVSVFCQTVEGTLSLESKDLGSGADPILTLPSLKLP